eukprot:scaffold1954_cov268-Pinguiococcus_pyrenoidosus.AAC.25
MPVTAFADLNLQGLHLLVKLCHKVCLLEAGPGREEALQVLESRVLVAEASPLAFKKSIEIRNPGWRASTLLRRADERDALRGSRHVAHLLFAFGRRRVRLGRLLGLLGGLLLFVRRRIDNRG